MRTVGLLLGALKEEFPSVLSHLPQGVTPIGLEGLLLCPHPRQWEGGWGNGLPAPFSRAPSGSWTHHFCSDPMGLTLQGHPQLKGQLTNSLRKKLKIWTTKYILKSAKIINTQLAEVSLTNTHATAPWRVLQDPQHLSLSPYALPTLPRGTAPDTVTGVSPACVLHINGIIHLSAVSGFLGVLPRESAILLCGRAPPMKEGIKAIGDC